MNVVTWNLDYVISLIWIASLLFTSGDRMETERMPSGDRAVSICHLGHWQAIEWCPAGVCLVTGQTLTDQ